jgi:uncharacterized protein with von Willebrand factor type A (vWA) domain
VLDALDDLLGRDRLEADEALDQLFNRDNHDIMGGPRGAGLGKGVPQLVTWLGTINRHFPESTGYMETWAIQEREWKELLLQKDVLDQLEKNVSLIALLLQFKQQLPDETRQSARLVVRAIVDDLRKRFETKLRAAFHGETASHRYSPLEIEENLDVERTIEENLHHYDPVRGMLLPAELYYVENTTQEHEWEIVIVVDRSGSMAESLVYASIWAAVCASLPMLRVRVIFFDTEIADLSEHLKDPVELIFANDMGGGTNIAGAVEYGERQIGNPKKSLFLLVSDLYEGMDRSRYMRALKRMKDNGVKVMVVLALNDLGRKSYDEEAARDIKGKLGIPAFCATPDKMVEIFGKALTGEGIR